jgi:hypothetical protein
VIRSEIRSRAQVNCAFALFLHPSYQRDTARRPIGTGRVVDLDIGASKSDICAIRVVTISERVGMPAIGSDGVVS